VRFAGYFASVEFPPTLLGATAMSEQSEALRSRRDQVDCQISAAVEADIAAALAGEPIANADLVNRLAQERNILDAAIERLQQSRVV